MFHPFPEASGVVMMEWRLLPAGLPTPFVPLNQGDIFVGDFVIIHVSDTSLAGNTISDSISVLLTGLSTGDSFTLTLTENGDLGTFDSGRIILTQGTAGLLTTDTVIVTVEDQDCDLGCDINVIDVLPSVSGVNLNSDSDLPGIDLTLTETGIDTRLFTATFNFTTIGPSSGTTLHVNVGDAIGVRDNTTFTTIDNLILLGSLDQGVILTVPTGINTVPPTAHFARAIYNGVNTTDLEIIDDGAVGRGGGGLVRPSLVVDSSPGSPAGLSGSGCSGDCSPPTLGIGERFNRIVSQGFSYNNNPVDVKRYYTSYPLITSNVGHESLTVLKIYDNGGTQNIEHVGLGFGLGRGESFSDSKATINLDITRDGQEITTIYDPENVLENVRIVTAEEPCSTNSQAKCLVVSIFHTFRESLNFNMVATYVWDFKKNAWQNYYNHGIEIVGDSLNPPKTELVAFGTKEMRGMYELIQIDKKEDTWQDEFGNMYHYLGNYRFDVIYEKPKDLVYDTLTMHGCDRHCNWFNNYKLQEQALAEITLNEVVLAGKPITDDNSLTEPFFHEYQMLERLEDPELQQAMLDEIIKAQVLYDLSYEDPYD
jgi:hypothetical protein